MTNYNELDAWKLSIRLATDVYKTTNDYPREELFGLVSQTRRATISIPANIAEGLGRKSARECSHFLTIARGSGYEVETLLSLALAVEMLPASRFELLDNQLSSVLRLVNGLIRHYDQKVG